MLEEAYVIYCHHANITNQPKWNKQSSTINPLPPQGENCWSEKHDQSCERYQKPHTQQVPGTLAYVQCASRGSMYLYNQATVPL